MGGTKQENIQSHRQVTISIITTIKSRQEQKIPQTKKTHSHSKKVKDEGYYIVCIEQFTQKLFHKEVWTKLSR